MRYRCSNPKRHGYEYYGGKGVTVCPEWNEYLIFRKWSLANGYKEFLELDRIDPNGNYCPENCRWVTPKINNNNKRNNVYMTAFGETKTVAEWSEDERCRVPYRALLKRKQYYDYDDERAITQPSHRRT